VARDLIKIENLAMRLGEFSLKEVNLQIEKGEFLTILGPIGSGKTTLLKCIAGIYRPERGRIEIDGQDVTKLPPEKRGVGYVPQDYKLFPHLNVRENIAFGLRLRKMKDVDGEVETISSLVGLTPILTQCVKCLSEGQKQLVALARALAIKPKLLLLDEPFARLDLATKTRLQKEMEKIHEQTKTTAIHVTHDFEGSLKLGNRIVIMENGRLLNEPKAIERYLEEKLGHIPITSD
jgi:molybdate/tungstate transport system ATP-binding protein